MLRNGRTNAQLDEVARRVYGEAPRFYERQFNRFRVIGTLRGWKCGEPERREEILRAAREVIG